MLQTAAGTVVEPNGSLWRSDMLLKSCEIFSATLGSAADPTLWQNSNRTTNEPETDFETSLCYCCEQCGSDQADDVSTAQLTSAATAQLEVISPRADDV